MIIVQILLVNGASINSKTNGGSDALYFSKIFLTKIIRHYETIFSFVASAKGHKNIVEILLANGAEPNARTNYGHTALHLGKFLINKKSSFRINTC